MTTITITLPRATVEQALEALEDWDSPVALPAIIALRAALAQQAEPVEPVAGVVLNEEGRAALVEHGREEWHCAARNARRLYTAPPKLVPLTEEEIDALPWNGSPRQFARAVERALEEKNRGR